MKEEELIKKLENIELPDIKLQSHQRRLRIALLDAGYLKSHRWGTVLELVKSKVKGIKEVMTTSLVLRQPVWRTILVGVLAIALITGLVITLPSLTGQSVQALAADIAQNSPQVRAALGGGEVQVVKVIKVVDDKGTVICKGELGIITAEVDLKREVVTEVITLPELTTADEQKVIDIARADSRIKELLDKGASIGNVSSMYSFGVRWNAETGEAEEFSEMSVQVTIELGERTWAAHVDLTDAKVIRLEETTPGARESYSSAEGKVEYFEYS